MARPKCDTRFGLFCFVLFFFFFGVFLGSFLCCSQNDNDSKRYLEKKNGYKLNMKVKK